MAKFLIEMPHTYEACMEALDQMAEQGQQLLNQTWWGCPAGDHRGWAFVDAPSQSEALNMVPEPVREEVCVTEVQQFSADQISQMHRMAA